MLVNSATQRSPNPNGLCRDAAFGYILSTSRNHRMDADPLASARVALVHDWLTGMRGGEKVLDVFCRRWPEAPLYTLLHRRGSVAGSIVERPVHTSWLEWLPGVHRYYRYTLPLMPRAARWRLPECDLVLSVSHCVAKAALPPPGTPHVCYCLTPMRYAWHMRRSYGWRGVKGWLVDRLLDRIREWDRETAGRVTHFLAISRAVGDRIRDCYGRESIVIHPPVDTHFYCPADVPREDYYLALSAFAPYKRLDLAIEACNRLRRRLVVIGNGQDAKRLHALAGPTVQFLGWQSDEAIRDHLRRCRALLFPGEEDFGIVPVEAQACGAPVIAYGRGGILDTVIPLGAASVPTGVFFEEQTADALIGAMERLEANTEYVDPLALRKHAIVFGHARFEREIFGFLRAVIAPRTLPAVPLRRAG
jgi:glycosyltransferase involved in cell wall biosynthesis